MYRSETGMIIHTSRAQCPHGECGASVPSGRGWCVCWGGSGVSVGEWLV